MKNEDEQPGIRYQPTDEDLQMLEQWLEGRPEVIVTLVRKLPPWNCYRQKGMPRSHYAIGAYAEDGTVTLNHGRDSFLPGVQVFGVKAGDVVPCGCGKFYWPTPQQLVQTNRRIEAARRRRK